MSDPVLEATQELLAVLPLLSRIVAAEVRREAGEDTSMPQFRVLAHLAARPLTLSALAKKRRVSLQSMSELVQALVLRGWVAREPDPRDRRHDALPEIARHPGDNANLGTWEGLHELVIAPDRRRQ